MSDGNEKVALFSSYLERRMIMKCALSLILVLVMLLGMVATTAFAVEEMNTTEVTGATVSPYLQPLTENIIGCSNLY